MLIVCLLFVQVDKSLSPFALVCKHKELKEGERSDSQAVLSGESAGGSVSAVEPVLQVDAGLSYQVVPSHQVKVIDQHRQQSLLRKRRLYFKGSDKKKQERELEMFWCQA